jgi:hypothetical protein
MTKSKINWRTSHYKQFVKDIEEYKTNIVYKKLRKDLSLKANRMNFEKLIQANDMSSENFATASDLYLIALDEYEKFEIYYNVQISKLNDEAQEELEKLKKQKKLSSQITKDLKLSWINKNRKKEITMLENKRRILRTIRKRMEDLKNSWKQRMSTLQSQMKAVESRRIISLGGNHGQKEN